MVQSLLLSTWKKSSQILLEYAYNVSVINLNFEHCSTCLLLMYFQYLSSSMVLLQSAHNSNLSTWHNGIYVIFKEEWLNRMYISDIHSSCIFKYSRNLQEMQYLMKCWLDNIFLFLFNCRVITCIEMCSGSTETLLRHQKLARCLER